MTNFPKEAPHGFSPSIASKYGVDEAILISHFQYWINHNKRLGRNRKDGRTWSYQTREEIAAHFPYWSASQVRRITDSLVKKGVLRKANYNKNCIDKTLWYAFENEKMFTIDDFDKSSDDFVQTFEQNRQSSDEIVNRVDEIVKPIPHSKTHTRTEKRKYIKEKFGEEEVVQLTSDEHAKLVEQFGEEGAAIRIQNLEDYILSKGAKYNSHYRTILMWERKNASNPQYKAPGSNKTNEGIATHLEKLYPLRNGARARVEALHEYVDIGNGVHQSTCVYYNSPTFKKDLQHALRKWGLWSEEVEKIF